MLDPQSEFFDTAFRRLQQAVTNRDWDKHGEDPSDPETIHAMQIVVNIPKLDPPPQLALVAAAAEATVRLCLDDRAGVGFEQGDGSFAAAIDAWYQHRIRKVTRRARNAAWERVQLVPGITASYDGAQARAIVPSAVHRVDPVVAKLQIGGTNVDDGNVDKRPSDCPHIYLDAGLDMSTGKLAAQAGHASMLLAANMSLDWVQEWARADFPLAVEKVDSQVFGQLLESTDVVVVRDAGFTEVAAGSATALAAPRAIL
ncbi:hypothetical protein CMUST_12555 [Corynebacterium mustelae]|uniref:peptidyl-tRNA hydrolase n=1 Tax=Corynebacterium mustelae TaxID=571915 RepID=A0A0G3H087_9CORY|nr:peptidyl-tRNA hydrolase [Corynebacterium mustelae]AKK06816.1 hypothetical protein CMUST_12555 [Corynebacterium mustelae]